MTIPANRRILLVDDMPAIHADFHRILAPHASENAKPGDVKAARFGHELQADAMVLGFEMDAVCQGQEGLDLVQRALAAGRPYAMAFLKVRMPSGLDGLETARKIWAIDPEVQLVLITACSDYSSRELVEQLGHGDGWLLLKKPFDPVEVRQLAHSLTWKWHLQQTGNTRQQENAEEKIARNAVLAREALDYEHDLLHTLLDNVPDHIYFKDAQSRFIKSGRAQARQFGVESPDELVGKSDFDFFSEEHARPAFEDEQEIIRTGQPIIGKVEKEVWNDGRDESWVLTTKMPLRNRDGEIVGTFGISRDITGIKRTEAELAYERDLLETLMKNSPDSIFFKDLQSRFVKISLSEVNNLLRLALSRYRAAHPTDGGDALPPHLTSAEEFQKYVIGKSDADIYESAQASGFCHDEEEIIRTGQPIVEKSEKTVHPDGRVVWYLTTKGPWRDPNGEIIGTFGTSKNLSELKEAQQKIEEVQAQLLTTARLAGMAEIATNVLHNVGNVLNSVNVSADLISTRLHTSRLKGLARAVGLMDEHADDLGQFLTQDPRGKLLPTYLRELAQTLELEHAAMAEELLALGKSVDHIKEVVATQQSYAGTPRFVESLNFNELVDDALRMNAEALTRHKVDVVKNLAELPELPLDRNRVLQILVNLISNAKQAVYEVTDRVPCITLGAIFVDGRVLRITVADNGEGITAENLSRVFSHGFTTRKRGHGFGLHSCVLAAQEMGGHLSAHSDGAGQGATFTLDLPVDVPERKR